MKFGTRLFLAYFVVLGLGIAFFLNSAQNQLRPAVRQASEEALVDTANLLAEIVAPELVAGFPQPSAFDKAVKAYQRRTLNAQIWSLLKTAPDFSVYVTNANGMVKYHSNPDEIGADYSEWRDVNRTLNGEYGARTSGADPTREITSTMFVAAPVIVNGERIGVLTVSQPNAGIEPFLTDAYKTLWTRTALVFIASLLIGVVLSWLFSRSIMRLLNYVEKVGSGQRASLPKIRQSELNRLALATEKMRREIDGKDYVENYIHTLTHEMKSPLSAIHGATELLQESELPAEQRDRFLSNIGTQSQRLQQLIDQLLSLASVEKRNTLENPETLSFTALVKACVEAKAPLIRQKNLRIHQQMIECSVVGEAFLLQQAVSNLLDNAIDFCLDNGEIRITLSHQPRGCELRIMNEGEPIPEYAKARLFERFYSLARPSSGKKSSGLGLSFVKEVAALHGGVIDLHNVPDGVAAVLVIENAR